MSGGLTASPLLEILQIRRKLIFHIFLGAMAIAAAGAFLTLRYSASAAVALDPKSALHEAGTASPVELAWAALSDKQILAIIQQFHLDSGMTRLRARDKVFTYVRSNITLHELNSGGSEMPAIELSFRGPGPSTTVDVANALAQSLTGTRTTPARQPAGVNPENISQEIEKSRATLQLLSQTQNSSTSRAELQKYFSTDSRLQAARRETVIQLAALDQQTAQAALAASKTKAQAPAPPPPDPQAVALRQQIKQVQAHLAALRQRYTDAYPEVAVAEETLATLEINLSHLSVRKPLPRPSVHDTGPTADELSITDMRDQILARQRSVDRAIANNRSQAELVRQRIADAKTFTQDYAFEQQRYDSLLKQQQAEGGELEGTPVPRFIVVQRAAAANAEGIAVKPLFWILSMLSALFVACLAAFAAEQFNPEAGTEVTPRSLHTS